MVVAVGARVRVSSLSLGERFYVDGLGLNLFAASERCLVLKAREGYVVLEQDSGSGAQMEATRPSGLILAVHAPLGVFSTRLEPLGARRIRCGEAPWGGIELVIVDPFGNELSLYTTGG